MATKAFLTHHGAWTSDIRKAARYRDINLLFAATRNCKLRDVEVYYSFDDHCPTKHDFALGLG